MFINFIKDIIIKYSLNILVHGCHYMSDISETVDSEETSLVLVEINYIHGMQRSYPFDLQMRYDTKTGQIQEVYGDFGTDFLFSNEKSEAVHKAFMAFLTGHLGLDRESIRATHEKVWKTGGTPYIYVPQDVFNDHLEVYYQETPKREQLLKVKKSSINTHQGRITIPHN